MKISKQALKCPIVSKYCATKIYLHVKYQRKDRYEEHAVVFEITVTYKEPEFTIWGKILNGLSLEGMAQPKSGDAPNLIFIAEGPITAYRPFVEPHTSSGKDFDWGSWFSGMGNGYAFHESAHLFGIYEDRYDEYTENPLPGYENYVTADGKGSYVQKPAPEEVREIIDLAVDRGQFTEEGNPLSFSLPDIIKLQRVAKEVA